MINNNNKDDGDDDDDDDKAPLPVMTTFPILNPIV